MENTPLYIFSWLYYLGILCSQSKGFPSICVLAETEYITSFIWNVALPPRIYIVLKSENWTTFFPLLEKTLRRFYSEIIDFNRPIFINKRFAITLNLPVNHFEQIGNRETPKELLVLNKKIVCYFSEKMLVQITVSWYPLLDLFLLRFYVYHYG